MPARYYRCGDVGRQKGQENQPGDVRWYQVLRLCDLAYGHAIIEETAPDGMGTGEKPDESGISIGQAVFATEDEPHLLAALLRPDWRGNDHGALTDIAFGGCHSEDPGRERVRLGGDGDPIREHRYT